MVLDSHLGHPPGSSNYMKKMNPSNSVSPSVPPSFRGELYFLMAKFLENGPCTETAARLKIELTEKSLLQPRYDWKGIAHAKTFRDMEEEFDSSGNSIPKEHLLQLCFDLCNVNPAVPTVRSLLSHSRLENKRRKANAPTVANLMKQIQNKDLGIGHYPNSNIWASKGSWHEKHLCRHLKRLRKTLGHLSSVYCLTFDRTGRLAFTGADDMLVKCWNVSDGRLLYTFRGGAAEVSDMTVSHDNRMLAVATLDKIARVWDLHTGEPIAVLTRHTGTLTGINFSSYVGSDGQRYLACTSSDGTAAFWRYKYANCTSTGSKLKSTVKTDTTSKSFKVEFDEQPTRWCERSRPGKAKIISSCFSPGGLFFCTGSADHYVRIYQMDCADGPQRILEEGEHEDQVDSIQWCNTSQLRLLSGSSDGTARIWTYKAGKWNTIVLNMNQSETSSCTSARKERPKNQETAESYPQQPPISLATANRPPGRLGNERRGVQQAEPEQRRPARRAAAQAAAMVNAAHAANDQQANANLQSPLGSRDIPSISGNDHTNSINNGSSSSQDEKKAVTMVQWSTDDRYAITAVADFTLKVWNSQNGTLVTILKGHSSLVYTVEPHPLTENIFLSAGHDGYLKVWDISTSTCLFSARNIIDMQGHAAVYDAKWSPGDGNIICATDSHGHLVFFGPGSSERYEKYPTELFFHTDYRPLLRDSYHNVVDEQTQTLPHLMPPPLLIDSEGTVYSEEIQDFVIGRQFISNPDVLQSLINSSDPTNLPMNPQPYAYKMCILKANLCQHEIQEGMRNVKAKSIIEASQFKKESSFDKLKNAMPKDECIPCTSKSRTGLLSSVKIRKRGKRNKFGTYSEKTSSKEEENPIKLEGSIISPASLGEAKQNLASNDYDSEDEPLIRRKSTKNTISRKSKLSASGNETNVPLAKKTSSQRLRNGHSDPTSASSTKNIWSAVSKSKFSDSEVEDSPSSDNKNERQSDYETSDKEFVRGSSPGLRTVIDLGLRTLGLRTDSRDRKISGPQKRGKATKNANTAIQSDESYDEKYDTEHKSKSIGRCHQSSRREKLVKRDNIAPKDNQSLDYPSRRGESRDTDKVIGKMQKQTRVARINYNESGSDSSFSGRENRQPTKRYRRRSHLRKQSNINYSDSDFESENELNNNSKPATITSSGRLSKPNPRII